MEADLLALAVEVTSVIASRRTLRKPIELKRPEKTKPDVTTPRGRDAAFKQGLAVLRSTARQAA